LPVALRHTSPGYGQSLADAQPHVPPMQAFPSWLPTHPVQAPPEDPHAGCVLPGAQTPALQQPPLQGWLAEQLVVQVCVMPSQACSAGQSVDWLHRTHPAATSQTSPLFAQSVEVAATQAPASSQVLAGV
jgi:hypothetical protein